MSIMRNMLTDASGPVVVSEKTMRALVAIRRDRLLPQIYEQPIVMSASNFAAMSDVLPAAPDWLRVVDDAPRQELPSRCESATPSEAATLRLAIALPASVVLIDGPIKERAKLSFIKCEGTLSVLVAAYRTGRLTAVQPMVKALRSLGHADVLPDEVMLNALWKALADLRDEEG